MAGNRISRDERGCQPPKIQSRAGIQEEALFTQFKEQVDLEYKGLLKKLDRKKPDLSRLSQEYQQIVGKDYFHSEIGKQARNKLLAL